MNAKDAIKNALTSTQNMLGMYIADLSDADLLVRPVPNANHIAWQLGHLITSEKSMMKDLLPNAKFPELPKGFDERTDELVRQLERLMPMAPRESLERYAGGAG